MLFCSVFYGMFMANAYKPLGEKNGIDDHFLTLTGAFGSVMNGSSRIFWAVI